MATPGAQTFTTPVARLVGGNLYKPNTTDLEGNPLMFKSGAKKGQPGREDYYFAIAIPKGVERHWAETEWGAKIWAAGHASVPNAGQRQFSWKVKDGDDMTPDDKGRRACDREGYARHWILNVSSGFPTKIFQQRAGSNPPAFDVYNTPEAVKTGYYVQVQINCDYNGSTVQPGVYLNHNMVCFSAFGPEITISGADPSSAGFGGAPLPVGATTTPPANFNPAAVPPAPGAAVPPPLVPNLPPPPPAPAPVAAAPTLQPVPGAAHTIEALRAANWTDDQIVAGGHAVRAAPFVPAGSALPPPPPAPIASVPAPTPLVPNPAFLQVPGGAPAVPPPPGAPAAPARVMLPGANGVPYESYIAQKWTDQMLIANGMMAA